LTVVFFRARLEGGALGVVEMLDFDEAPPYISDLLKVETYEDISEILKSPDFEQGSHTETAPLIKGSLVMVDGQVHRERRHMLSGLMSRAALEYYELRALQPLIEQVFQEQAKRRGPDGYVRADLVELVNIMLHRITAAVTGIDDVTTPERTERFRWLAQKIGEAVSSEWTVGDRDEIIRIGLELRRQCVQEFILPSLERRRELVASYRADKLGREELPTDLLTVILLHWQDHWDEAWVWQEATLFIVAAIETTTHALPHVVKELADWIDAHPDDKAKLTDPDFLKLASNETLRLHVPVPTLQRKAIRNVELKSGRRFRTGDHIALLFGAANREPMLFGADADRFNPYRVTARSVQPWGLTFGGGPHLCMGRPLVTGTSQRTGDEASTTQGTMVRILGELYRRGLALDAQPQRNQREYRGFYETMPVVFSNL